jgi:predicted nucleic acid-binding protein
VGAFVDTNILVRPGTGDPPAQAAWATKFLATSDELLLADLVVAEVVYVLESFYQVSRERLAELVRSISAHHSCSGRMTGRPVSYARAHD